MLSLWYLPQYQALQMHLTSVLLTKRPQSCWYTRETRYLLPPCKQIKENGRAPGSAHASLFRCQGSLASFWVGLRRVFFPRKGQLCKWSQNNLFMRHPWEMFYFQEIWSPCGLLGEMLARSFQDLSLPRALWNTSALSKRAAPSQVVLPGSSYICFSELVQRMLPNTSDCTSFLLAISAGYWILFYDLMHFMFLSNTCIWN